MHRNGKMRPCADMCNNCEGLDTVLCFSMLTVVGGNASGPVTRRETPGYPTEQFIRVAQMIAVSHIVTMISAASLVSTNFFRSRGKTTGRDMQPGAERKKTESDSALLDACNDIASLFRKACGGTPARFAHNNSKFENIVQIREEVFSKCVPFLHKICVCIGIVAAADSMQSSKSSASWRQFGTPGGKFFNDIDHVSSEGDDIFLSLCAALGLPSLASILGTKDKADASHSSLLRTALAWARHTCSPHLSQVPIPTMPNYAIHAEAALWNHVLRPKHVVDWGLVELPTLFTDLYSSLRRKTCYRCEECPKRLIGLYLLCGAVMCAGNKRCHHSRHEPDVEQPVGSCTLHAGHCHNGQSAYFIVQENTVVLTTGQSGSLACYYPSLYLDSDGEDIGRVSSGKHRQLYLAPHRYEALGRMVATNNVGHIVSQNRNTLERVVRVGWF